MCDSHSITAKCRKCKQEIQINRENCEQFIRCDEFSGVFYYYHSECFRSMIPNKVKRAKCEEARLHWEKYISESGFKALQEESTKFLKDKISRDELYHFLIKEYDLKVFPNQLFPRLEQVHTGQYKNLLEPISPEDLVYMWKTKINTLNKIARKKVSEGKVFKDEYTRLCWDLSCLIQWYDKYKKWKQEQELLVEEQRISLERNKKDDKLNKAIYLQSKTLSNRDKVETDEEWEYNHRFDGLTLEDMIDKYW